MRKVVLKLISNYTAEHGFGFQKVNWICTGGVITSHAGSNAFGMAEFVQEYKIYTGGKDEK